MRTFKKKMKIYLIENNITITEFCKTHSISRPSILYWMRGGKPRMNNLIKLCKATNDYIRTTDFE